MKMTFAASARARSPRAFDLYRALVENSNRAPIDVRTGYRLTEAELTWDELPALEAEVFGIDPGLVNALVWAAVRYENMIGTVDSEFYELREEERTAFPECFRGEAEYDFAAAVGFMVVACGLPRTQALVWQCRAQVQLVRSGLFGPDETAPGWAYGAVKDGD